MHPVEQLLLVAYPLCSSPAADVSHVQKRFQGSSKHSPEVPAAVPAVSNYKGRWCAAASRKACSEPITSGLAGVVEMVLKLPQRKTWLSPIMQAQLQMRHACLTTANCVVVHLTEGQHTRHFAQQLALAQLLALPSSHTYNTVDVTTEHVIYKYVILDANEVATGQVPVCRP